MNERPILFSALMVQAILAGKKTQTRRVAKVTDEGCKAGMITPLPGFSPRSIQNHIPYCPYGAVGDHLWVRETTRANTTIDWYPFAEYAADGEQVADAIGDMVKWSYSRPVRPSIHMPRNQCRIVLEITAVRIERLNAISADDCRAEGCPGGHGSIPGYNYSAMPQEHYWWLWDKINGEGSHMKNPWVWVVEFKRVGEL